MMTIWAHRLVGLFHQMERPIPWGKLEIQLSFRLIQLMLSFPLMLMPPLALPSSFP